MTKYDMLGRFKETIQSSIEVKQKLLSDDNLIIAIAVATESVLKAIKNGNRVLFAGNGGSAADAQHLAAEFVSRFEFDRPGLPALSIATDTSMLTAIGNDYGYDRLFLRQLQAQARPGDVFVGITTSGRSPNIISAFEACKDLKICSIALCGLGGELEGLVDHLLRVPCSHTPRIQESHILIGHMICAEVEIQMFGHLSTRKE